MQKEKKINIGRNMVKALAEERERKKKTKKKQKNGFEIPEGEHISEYL